MKVSIIIPVYNCEKYIKKCIESIKAQTYKNWELILIDDGSKDNSFKICRQYSEKDERIFVLTQKNKGAGLARNYGIDVASGEYIVFCDSDDFLDNRCLEVFCKIALKRNPDLIISGYNEFKYVKNNEIMICGKNNAANLEILNKEEARKLYIELHKKCLIQAPWAKFYKAKIIKENMIGFSDFRRCQDTVFNLKYYEYINNIIVIEDKLYNYLTPDDNTFISKFPKDYIEIRKKLDYLISNKLKEWNSYNNEAKLYLNKVLLNQILISLRLNYLNNWNLNKKERKEYVKKLLSDNKVIEIIEDRKYGFVRNILCYILRTKSYILIQLMNFFIVNIQKIKVKVRKINEKSRINNISCSTK